MLSYISNPVLCPQAKAKADCLNNTACEKFSIEIYASIQEISFRSWDKIVPKDHFFLNRAYLTAFETCLPNNVATRYVVLKEKNKLLGVAYFQLLQISEKNWNPTASITTKTAGVKNYIIRNLEKVVKKASGRVLVCGNMFVTGEHGFHHSKAISHATAFSLLYRAAEKIQQVEAKAGNPVTAMLIKDFHPDTIQKAQTLQLFNLQEIKAEQNMLLAMRPEWLTFEDYLQSMTAKYRTRAKSVLKKGKTLSRRLLSLTDIVEHRETLHQQYNNIVDQVDFKMGTAPLHYFSTLKAKLGEQFQVIGYFLEEQLIGFISLFITPNEIEAHFIGYDTVSNRKYKLYQNILYDIVQTGIQHQVKNIWFGRTAPEIKSTVGAVGLDMNLFGKHNNYFIHQFLSPVLRRLDPPAWEQRNPFKAKATVSS